jgi:hypothetical protein
MARIRHEISMLNTSITSIGTSSVRGQIDPNQYNGTKEYYFEFSGLNTGGTLTMVLTDGTQNVTATQTLTTTATLYRLPFTITPSSETTYNWVSAGTGTPTLRSARIIVIQDTGNNPVTSTESQFELAETVAIANTAYVPTTNPKYFTYTAANFDGTQTYYFESSFKMVTAGTTAGVRLEVDNGAYAGWAAVTGCTLTTTSTTPVYLKSTAFTPIDGRHYRIAVTSGHATNQMICYTAKFIVQQTGTVTKFQEQYQLLNREHQATGLQNNKTQFLSSDWSGVTNTYQHLINGKTASASAKLVNLPSTDITNSTVTGINEVVSSPITLTSGLIIDTNVISNTSNLVTSSKINVIGTVDAIPVSGKMLFGASTPTAIKLGNSTVTKIYKGINQVYP